MIRVDDGRWPLGRMKMSHLIADSHEELAACAGALGLSPDYIQYPHTWKERLDVSRSKRGGGHPAGSQGNHPAGDGADHPGEKAGSRRRKAGRAARSVVEKTGRPLPSPGERGQAPAKRRRSHGTHNHSHRRQLPREPRAGAGTRP